MEEIEKIMAFIIEVEKLKGIQRKTRPVGLDRFENSAEHSWHVCLAALLLKDVANEPINIDRCIKMLLIHDLGEIDAGDTVVYQRGEHDSEAEEAGLKRVLSLLPEEMGAELLELWREFEYEDTPDARFARAIDRVPPLLHNIHGGGHSWKAYGVSGEQVLALNQRIGEGSEKLWSFMRSELEQAMEEGILG